MSNSTKNAASARRWFEEVWGQRKLDIVHELLLPHSVAHTDNGDLVGPEPFLAFHQRMFEAMPDLRVTVEGVIAQDDAVAIRWTLAATRAGRPIHMQGVTWVHCKDGKMIEGWDCWNAAELERLLTDGSD
jgi:predicted ester cyclase